MSLFDLSSPASRGPSVVACLDQSAQALHVLATAAAMARSLRRPLVLFHVIEPPLQALNRDPLDWSLRRSQARRFLERLAAQSQPRCEDLIYDVTEGNRVDEIVRKGNEPGITLVLGASRAGKADRNTAQQVLEAGASRVILVPQNLPGQDPETIVVPLDGSGGCEAALVEAAHLAEQTGAGLVLVHVVPHNDLTLFGPPEADDLRLRGEVERRNHDCAARFLERTRRRLVDRGLRVRVLCLGGEARSILAQLVARERPALVVLSTRGQGGRHCEDLAVGGTARYLLNHAAGPMLLLSPDVSESQKIRSVSLTGAVDPTLAA